LDSKKREFLMARALSNHPANKVPLKTDPNAQLGPVVEPEVNRRPLKIWPHQTWSPNKNHRRHRPPLEIVTTPNLETEEKSLTLFFVNENHDF
jgi:hypothetical protein